jgi:hypothetical protein
MLPGTFSLLMRLALALVLALVLLEAKEVEREEELILYGQCVYEIMLVPTQTLSFVTGSLRLSPLFKVCAANVAC